MTDIVERLRGWCATELQVEAASEIERLRECVQLLEQGWQRHLEQREEARAAAREMFQDVLQYDPTDHCEPWRRKWPWLEESND